MVVQLDDNGTDFGSIRLRLRTQGHLLLILGLCMLALAIFVPHPVVSLALVLAGMVMGLVLLVVRAVPSEIDPIEHVEGSVLHTLIDGDLTPTLVASADGKLSYRNAAAETLMGGDESMTLESALSLRIADPGALTGKLQRRAQLNGAAREDVAAPGGSARLSVQSLSGQYFLWRLEEFGRRVSGETLDGVLPILSIGRGDSILYMNTAARRLAGARPKKLSDLVFRHSGDIGDLVHVRTGAGVERRRMVELAATDSRSDIALLPEPDSDAEPGSTLDEVGSATIWDVVDGLPVPILRLTTDGMIELANRAASQLLGIGKAPGLPLAGLMEGLGRSVTEWLGSCATLSAEGESGVHSEFLRLSRSEREVFVQVAVRRVDFRGQPALLAVISDATELKTLEAQFVQSQKMQAIGQLAGGVAHDFNNLLTAITGHCDLLLLRHDQGDPDYADLIQINQNANRAASLVGQLLAFSRKQTLQPELLDLPTTLGDLTHLLNRLVGEKASLSFSHEPNLPQIRADKRQLEQVLMNLVVNSRDAMPDGGEIRITTESLHLGNELLRDRATLPPGDYVLVKVSDNGSGISPDKLPKVFEPFFTTKRVGEGTGLGLSTAYGIIKQSGGYIFADSVLGEGTTFSLIFPAQQREVVEALPTPKLQEVAVESRGDGVVLLVEDEAPVRAFASRALRLKGYTVLEADSAEQALETLDSCRMKIDVFVTDVIMPGMDGPTWVRKALERHPGTKVVFVSGYAEDSFGEASARIPNAVFLPKPFSLGELTETVRKQISRDPHKA